MPDVPVGRLSVLQRRSLRTVAATCAIGLSLAAPAAADTLTLTGSSDSVVRTIFTPSDGTSDAFLVGNCFDLEMRLLVKFDVAGNPLPPGAQISSARVRVRYHSVSPSLGGDPNDVGLHRQFTAWTSSATWLTPDGSNVWEGGYPEHSYPYWPDSTANGFIEWDVTSMPLDEDAGGYMITAPYGGGCVPVHGLTADYPPALIIEYDT